MCSVQVTCNEQLQSHLNGAKHKGKLRSLEKAADTNRGKWGVRGRGRGRGRGGNGEGRVLFDLIFNIICFDFFQFSWLDQFGDIRTLSINLKFEWNFSIVFNISGYTGFTGEEHNVVTIQTQQSRKRGRDYSNFRTPSGSYYCSICNVTVNGENQFAQHMDSRKHKSKYANHKISEEEQQQQEVASWEQEEVLCVCSDKLHCGNNWYCAHICTLHTFVQTFSLLIYFEFHVSWQQELIDVLKVMKSP